jgi:hypothetical protein
MCASREAHIRLAERSPEKAWSQSTRNVSIACGFSNLAKPLEISHLWSSPVLIPPTQSRL